MKVRVTLWGILNKKPFLHGLSLATSKLGILDYILQPHRSALFGGLYYKVQTI